MNRIQDKERMEGWRVQSPDTWGFHEVVIPHEGGCQEAQIFRLNLKAGSSYTLESKVLELHAVLIEGNADLEGHTELSGAITTFDSFYMPGSQCITITATKDCFFYVAGAKCEGYGKPLRRKFDRTLPIGDIHQIHGSGRGQREVMFTLSPKDKASRLICGLTWGQDGGWTSWPPHQHEKDLEEVYCYFDMPAPGFGFHISYLKSGDAPGMVTHAVQTGTCVQAPCGYHPTVASPGTKNTYFWVLASFSQESRRYDLAVTDPAYENC